jgi:hypothetical protein
MAGVKSIVRIDKGKLKRLSWAQTAALEKTAENLHADIQQEQVVPRRDGSLQGEQFFVDCSNSKSGRVSLVHATPYARRLYYNPEYDFSKDENPNARGKWFEPWVSGEYKDFVKKTFKKFYKQEAGL